MPNIARGHRKAVRWVPQSVRDACTAPWQTQCEVPVGAGVSISPLHPRYTNQIKSSLHIVLTALPSAVADSAFCHQDLATRVVRGWFAEAHCMVEPRALRLFLRVEAPLLSALPSSSPAPLGAKERTASSMLPLASVARRRPPSEPLLAAGSSAFFLRRPEALWQTPSSHAHAHPVASSCSPVREADLLRRSSVVHACYCAKCIRRDA